MPLNERELEILKKLLKNQRMLVNSLEAVAAAQIQIMNALLPMQRDMPDDGPMTMQ